MQPYKQSDITTNTTIDVLHTISVKQGTIYIVNVIKENPLGKPTAKVGYIFKDHAEKKFWVTKKEFKEMVKGVIDSTKNLSINKKKNDIDWVK